jgi:nucleoside-diphosphate-sugar epimerase
MGQEGLRQLLERSEKFRVVVLVLPSKKNKVLMKSYSTSDLKIVWGDLTNYENVIECVSGADYVLHVGGIVSPKADYYPERTTKVNMVAIHNILKAIKAQPNPDQIKPVANKPFGTLH